MTLKILNKAIVQINLTRNSFMGRKAPTNIHSFFRPAYSWEIVGAAAQVGASN